MNYTLLAELLPQLEDYQRHTPTEAQHAAGFAAWLLAQQPGPAADLPAAARAHPAAREAPSPYETDESLISKLLTFAYRYVRGYVRLALAGTPLVGFDDFTYLMSLFAAGPHTKSALMARNIHEKAPGTEVIKRLLKNGLVTEAPHATDRRSKLLYLTDRGRELLFEVLGPMTQVATMSAGDLTLQERQQLVHLLHRLDAFHHRVFAAARPESFAELVAAHFPHAQPAWPPPGLGAMPEGVAGPPQ